MENFVNTPEITWYAQTVNQKVMLFIFVVLHLYTKFAI